MKEPVIDAHMHLYPVDEWAIRRTTDHPIDEYGSGFAAGIGTGAGGVDASVAALRRAGATAGLAFNLFEPSRVSADLSRLPPGASISPEATAGEYLVWLNDWLCRAARSQPFLNPIVAADPIALPGRALTEHLEAMVAAGAVGVKIHHAFQHLAPDDERLEPLYAACVELRIPLVAHSGSTVPLLAFDPVLRRWPGLTLVLAHTGGAVWRSAPDLAATHENVRFDLAEIVWWLDSPIAPSGRAMVDLIRAIGPGRVLFGSDFPWYEPSFGVDRIRQLGLSPGEEAAVLGGNAASVFGLASTNLERVVSS